MCSESCSGFATIESWEGLFAGGRAYFMFSSPYGVQANISVHASTELDGGSGFVQSESTRQEFYQTSRTFAHFLGAPGAPRVSVSLGTRSIAAVVGGKFLSYDGTRQQQQNLTAIQVEPQS